MNVSRILLNNATVNITSNVYQGFQPFHLLYEQICAAAFDNTDAFEDMKCYPGTRTLLLERLETWLSTPGNIGRLITWLNGPMGAGKTAVARTLADRGRAINKLLGMFMFSRSFPGRNNESRFITTLAFQLAISIPQARPFIEGQILHNPAILQQSLSQQLDLLILEPLRQIRQHHTDIDIAMLPNLIIVDGLDECGAAYETGKEERQIKVLDLIRRLALSQDIFPFIVLVLSRPERHIRNWFAKETLQNVTHQLSLDRSYKPKDDIRLFVTQHFLAILDDHPSRDLLPEGWPYSVHSPIYQQPINAIDFIVESSAGQFIYPSVVMRFVRSQQHRPDQRLLTVINCSARKDEPNSPHATLDLLFHQILEATDDQETVRKILAYNSVSDCAPWGTIPLPRIERLVDISNQGLRHTLDKLESLLILTLKPFLTFYHASFSDFLYDPDRSQHWHIDVDKYAAEFALRASQLFHEESYIGAQRSYFNIFIMACKIAPPSASILKEIEKLARFSAFPGTSRFLTKVPLSNYVKLWHSGSRALSELLGLHLNRPHRHSIERLLLSELAAYVKPHIKSSLSSPERLSNFLQWVFCISSVDANAPQSTTKWPVDLRRLFWSVMNWGLECGHLQIIFSIPSSDFLDDALVNVLKSIGSPSSSLRITPQGWYWMTLFMTWYGPSEKLWICVLDSEEFFSPHFRRKLIESKQMDRFLYHSPEFRISRPKKSPRHRSVPMPPFEMSLAKSNWTSRTSHRFYVRVGKGKARVASRDIHIPMLT